ncbi:MAG: type 2 periplasmic-binding domain-containing protein, partial [Saccharofermentanales bacterium]
GAFLDFTSEGKIELALEKKNTMDALQFMQTACFTDKWMKPDGNFTWISDFKAGRLAMFCEGPFVRYMDFKDVSFDMEFVPFPLGSGNENGYLPGSTSGVGICRGAKNPYGVVEYLKFAAKYGEDNKDDANDPFKKVISAEQYQLYQDLLEIPRQPLFINGVADLQTKQFGLWTEILYNGTPIATAIASQKPVWQGQIDICMQDNKLPEVLPFTAPDVIDFEGGIIPDTLVCTDLEGNYIGITGAAITTDQTEVINGKSLKITVNPEEAILMAFRTTDKVKFPAYHSYEIQFDIKTLADMKEGSAFSVSLKDNDSIIEGQAVGYEEISGLTAGQVKHVTAVI